MNPDTWDAMLRQTAEDERLSSGEKRALRTRLRDAALDDRVRGVLRSRAFDLARERIGPGEGRAMIDWLEDINKLLLPTSGEGEEEYLEARFSPGEACVGRIVALFDSARRTVDACVFTITDDRITRAVLGAHERGVAVRVITDGDKTHDAGSDVHRMARGGVPVRVDRSSHHMHHKFALFDGRRVLTGSYNWTRSAAENNEENLVVSNDRRLLAAFSAEFSRLWDRFAPNSL